MTQRERQLLNWIEENPLISQQELADKAGITRSSVAVHISNLMKKGYITGKGYIVHTAPYVTVVGGVNMDIGGWPGEVPVMQDSNPGVVRMSLGGVGRNIAHNMALLGMDVRMVTVFGDDINAQKIAASCGELGIDISQSPIIPEGRTSTYLFITDEKGDMAPKVIASGRGFIADRIIKTAEESAVPVHKDEKLAKSLSLLDVGEYIPQELYSVVAEVLVYVDDMEKIQSKLGR